MGWAVLSMSSEWLSNLRPVLPGVETGESLNGACTVHEDSQRARASRHLS